jgi:hypothetical protein
MTIKGNYPISDSFRNTIKWKAESLLLRTVQLHEAFCPLSADDVTYGLTSGEDRDAFAHLKRRAIGVAQNDTLMFWVRGDDVRVPAKVRAYSPQGYPFMMLNQDPLVFDLDTLTFDRRAEFVEWLNAATRQRRIFKGATALTDAFVAKHCGDSIASLHTRWPEFTVVLLELEDPWPARARNLTSIKRSEYDWLRPSESYDWYLDNMRKMEVAGGLLAEAQMIIVPQDNSPIKFEVVDWKVEPG